MNTTTLSRHCQAAHPCQQPARFEALLEARGITQPIRRTRELCAEHLGDVVHELTTWARESGLTDGRVTVLIIDTAPGQLVSVAAEHRPHRSGLPFGTISLSQ